MSYRDELISLWSTSGDAKIVQIDMAKALIDTEIAWASLDSAKSKKLLEKIEELGGYQAAKEFVYEVPEDEKLKGESIHPEESVSETATEVVVSEKVQHALQNESVFDEDSKELVEVTPEMRNMANMLQQKLNATTLITALILKKFSDEKLYLAVGCNSFKEFAETCLPYGYRHSKRFLSIANHFAPLLPGDFDPKGTSMSLEESEEIAELSSLGSAKLYELTKIEDADFQEVFTKGKVVMPDGSEMTLDEIKDESARKLAERMKEFKKDYNQKLANTEEDKKKAQAERDHYKKELERNEKVIERAHELEELYGKEASRIAEIESLLSKASEYINKADYFFGRVQLDMDDPEVLQESARSVMRKLNNMQTRAISRFEWFNELEEMEVTPKVLMKNGESTDSANDAD